MRKAYALAGCLLLIAKPVMATWVEYGDNGKATFYYDDSSLTKSGPRATIDEMLNYAFPLRGVMSNRSTKEFDCERHAFRYLSGEFYAEPNLGGQRISESGGAEDQWRDVIDGTQNWELMHIACGIGV